MFKFSSWNIPNIPIIRKHCQATNRNWNTSAGKFLVSGVTHLLWVQTTVYLRPQQMCPWGMWQCNFLTRWEHLLNLPRTFPCEVFHIRFVEALYFGFSMETRVERETVQTEAVNLWPVLKVTSIMTNLSNWDSDKNVYVPRWMCTRYHKIFTLNVHSFNFTHELGYEQN